MLPSLGIISGAFALRNHVFAPGSRLFWAILNEFESIGFAVFFLGG